MSKCLIGAMCIGDECQYCSNYDFETSVEIRVYDYNTNNVEYKTLRRSELDELRKVLKLESI